MRFLPADLTPLSPLLKKVDQWTQPDRGVFKKHILSRVVTVVATPPLALISSLYNTVAFTVKAPVVLVRYTVLLIPIKKDGKWRTVGSLLPDSLGFKELAKHAAKVFAYAIDIFFGPLLGFISPRANIWVHEKLGLMTPRSNPRVNPYLGMDVSVNPSTPLLQPRVDAVGSPFENQVVQPKANSTNGSPVVQRPVVEQPRIAKARPSDLPNPMDALPEPQVAPQVAAKVSPPPPPPPSGEKKNWKQKVAATNDTEQEATGIKQPKKQRQETEEQKQARILLHTALNGRRQRTKDDDEEDEAPQVKDSSEDIFKVEVAEVKPPVVAPVVDKPAPNLVGIMNNIPVKPVVNRQTTSLRDEVEWA